jgi:hypothetical protein
MLLHLVKRPGKGKQPSSSSSSADTSSSSMIIETAVGYAMHISHAFQDGDLLHVFSSAWGSEGVTGEKLLGEWGMFLFNCQFFVSVKLAFPSELSNCITSTSSVCTSAAARASVGTCRCVH